MRRVNFIFTVSGADRTVDTVSVEESPHPTGQYVRTEDVRAAIEAAYREGLRDGREDVVLPDDVYWQDSKAKAALE